MIKMHHFLTYAGVLPFVAGAVATAWFPDQSFSVLPPIDWIVRVYTGMILSFMAGSHWGLSLGRLLSDSYAIPFYVMPLSTLLALIAWVLFLGVTGSLYYLCASFLFLILLVIDYRLYQAGFINRDYWQLRARVTTVVVTALLFMAYHV